MHLSLSIRIGSTLLLGSLSAGMISRASVALSSEIPEALGVPKDQMLLLKSKATGSQIYVCQSTDKDPSGDSQKPATYQWVLKAPEAMLLSGQGLPKGKHYLGPTWEWQDGSKVQGKIKAKVDAPEPQSIPWLLLEAKQPVAMAAQPGAVSGTLSSVKWIQRLNTMGGKAPQIGCDRTLQNREVRSSYAADYYFYGNRP